MNSAKLELNENYSIDSFHRGRFHLVQPLTGGHRSGIDAMLLAAALPDGFKGHCADLGAGAGAVGMAVLSRFDEAKVTLFENDPEMIECCQKSLALPQNQIFAGRAFVVEADVNLRGDAREAAGLANNLFDFAIFNPPFNDPSDRQTPVTQKAAAHVMTPSLFENWMRTCAAILKPGGGFALIARPQSLGEILNASAKRFGSLEIIPIQAHAEGMAIRIIVRGKKGSRAKIQILPAHILHAKGAEAFLEKAEAVNNGMSGI